MYNHKESFILAAAGILIHSPFYQDEPDNDNIYPVINNLGDMRVCGRITSDEIETGNTGELYYHEKLACFVMKKRQKDKTYYSESLRTYCIC